MHRRKQIATDWFGFVTMRVSIALITLLILLNKQYVQELLDARKCTWGRTGIRLDMSLKAGMKVTNDRSITVDMIVNENDLS